MKLYYGMGHLTYKRAMNRYDRELIRWVLSLKPGDIFGACTGFNHRLSEAKPDWYNHRRGKGNFIAEVVVTDTVGRMHYAPGGGCVCRPYPREDVVECVTTPMDPGWFTPEDQAKHEARCQAMLDAEKTDKPWIDAFGVYVGPPA